MPKFLIKCEYEKLYEATTAIDVEGIEDINEFMEEYEEEND